MGLQPGLALPGGVSVQPANRLSPPAALHQTSVPVDVRRPGSERKRPRPAGDDDADPGSVRDELALRPGAGRTVGVEDSPRGRFGYDRVRPSPGLRPSPDS